MSILSFIKKLFSKSENHNVTEKRKFGNMGESLAADYLKDKGYKIVERNLSINKDEIDIIAIDKNKLDKILVFVEVKTRKSTLYGGGIAAVNKRKQKALIRCASAYMKRYSKATKFRFDVVEIICDTYPYVINHYENAFHMHSKIITQGLHK